MSRTLLPVVIVTTAAAAALAAPTVQERFDPAIEAPVRSERAEELGLPFGGAAKQCRASFPLTQKNLQLTRALRTELEAVGLKKALAKKQLTVAVVDLTPKSRVHYAGINDDHMVYAASLPKIAAVLAVAQAAKEKKIVWNQAVATDAASAVRWSKNPAASRLVKRVGVGYIEDVLRRPGYCFYGDEKGGLWLGRGYGGGGESVRDPVAKTVHGATARQVARFYTMLDKGLLVGPVGNARIFKSMGPPEMGHKLVKSLGQEGAKVIARKSGTWRTFHSDSALVEHGDARYIVVALSNLKDGSAVVEKVGHIVDRLLVAGSHREKATPTQ